MHKFDKKIVICASKLFKKIKILKMEKTLRMDWAWGRNCSSIWVGNLVFNEGAAKREDLQFLRKRHDRAIFGIFYILIFVGLIK